MELANFKVRGIGSAEEIAAVFAQREVELGWKPGTLDHLSAFAADESEFFAGELDGKVISCLSVVKYSDEYAFVGQYIVDKPYRGQGYIRVSDLEFCVFFNPRRLQLCSGCSRSNDSEVWASRLQARVEIATHDYQSVPSIF